MPRREWLGLCGFLLLAVAIRLLLVLRSETIGADSARFVWMAQDIDRADFAAALYLGHHPFYPLLVAFVHLATQNWEIAAYAVSILLGAFALVPLYALTKDLFGERAGLWSVALFALHPLLVDISADIMTEGTYFFCALTTITATWFAIRKKTIALGAIVGLFGCLAYLTRPEGLVLTGVLTLILLGTSVILLLRGRRDGLKGFGAIALLIAIFLVGSAPYLLWARRQTGHWVISAKPTVQVFHGLTPQSPPETQPHDPLPPPEGQPPKYLSKNKEFRRDLGDAFGPLWNIVRFSARSFSLVPILGLSTFILFLRRHRPSLWPSFFILVLTGVLMAMPAYLHIVDDHPMSYRYFLLPGCLLFGWAGLGIQALAHFVGSWGGSWIRPTLMGTALLGMALPSFRHRRAEDRPLREAGQRIRDLAPTGVPVAASDERIVYYARGRTVPMEWWFGAAETRAQSAAFEFLAISARDLQKRLETGYLERVLSSPLFDSVGEYSQRGGQTVWLFRVRR